MYVTRDDNENTVRGSKLFNYLITAIVRLIIPSATDSAASAELMVYWDVKRITPYVARDCTVRRKSSSRTLIHEREISTRTLNKFTILIVCQRSISYSCLY